MEAGYSLPLLLEGEIREAITIFGDPQVVKPAVELVDFPYSPWAVTSWSNSTTS